MTYSYPELQKLEELIGQEDWRGASSIISDLVRGFRYQDLAKEERAKKLIFIRPLLDAAKLVMQKSLYMEVADDKNIAPASSHFSKKKPRDTVPAIRNASRTEIIFNKGYDESVINWTLESILLIADTFHVFEEGQEALRSFFDFLDRLPDGKKIDHLMDDRFAHVMGWKVVHVMDALVDYRNGIIQQMEPTKRFEAVRELAWRAARASPGDRDQMPFPTELHNLYMADIGAFAKFDLVNVLAIARRDIHLGWRDIWSDVPVYGPAYNIVTGIMQAWLADAAETSVLDLEKLPKIVEELRDYSERILEEKKFYAEMQDAAKKFLKDADIIDKKLIEMRGALAEDRAASLARKMEETAARMPALPKTEAQQQIALSDFSLARLVSPQAAKPLPRLPVLAALTHQNKTGDTADTNFEISESEIRRILQEARDNPVQLMGFGENIAALVSKVAFASLDAATATASMEAPVRSIAEFLEKFSAAKAIIEEKRAGQARPVQIMEAPKRGVLARIWPGKAAETPKELTSMADASGLATEAGTILKDMLPSLDNMEKNLYGQIGASYQLAKAYDVLAQQIAMVRTVGTEVLAEWKSENGTQAPAEGEDAPPQPFHIEALSTRLELFEQLETQVQNRNASHQLLVAVEQKQQQGVSTLRTLNLPVIAEQVATFIRQLEDLQRAAAINSLADATRQTAESEYSMHMMAAMATAAAIENLAGSTNRTLTDMGRATEEVTARIGPPELLRELDPRPKQPLQIAKPHYMP